MPVEALHRLSHRQDPPWHYKGTLHAQHDLQLLFAREQVGVPGGILSLICEGQAILLYQSNMVTGLVHQ